MMRRRQGTQSAAFTIIPLPLLRRLRAVVAVGALWWGGAAAAQVVFPAGSVLDIPAGASWNHACSTLQVQGTVTTAGQLAGGTVDVGATGVLNGSSGTITVGGDWLNAGTFAPGTGSVVFTDGCGAATATLAGSTAFHHLTLASTTGRTFVLPAAGITVNGTLTLAGTAAQPIQVVSAGGVPTTIRLGPGAQVVRSHATLAASVTLGAPAAGVPASIPVLGPGGLALLALGVGLAALRRLRGTRATESP